MGHLYCTHPWLTGLSSPLKCSVLLKVALFWLSSEHRPGVGWGQSTEKSAEMSHEARRTRILFIILLHEKFLQFEWRKLQNLCG